MKLPTASKTLSYILVFHPLRQVCDHPGILVSFYPTCSLNETVSKIHQNVNYQLYPIGNIRKYLDKTATEKMINSVMTSGFDYCHSLLYGISGYSVPQIQRYQNDAIRIVCLWWKYYNITPVLKYLHWLPFEQGMHDSILLLTYKASHGMAPPYLSSLLSHYKSGKFLRSALFTSSFWRGQCIKVAFTSTETI